MCIVITNQNNQLADFAEAIFVLRILASAFVMQGPYVHIYSREGLAATYRILINKQV